MKFYLNVGKLQRAEIESYDQSIENMRSLHKQQLKEFLIENVASKLNNELADLEVSHDRIAIMRKDRRWSDVDVTFDDRWKGDTRSWDVRFSSSSYSGYTSNENKDNLDYYVEAQNLSYSAVGYMEDVIEEYAQLVRDNEVTLSGLYKSRRELKNELDELLKAAQFANEDELLAELKNGIELNPESEDRSAFMLYTGYREDSEWVNHIEFVKNAGKSVLLKATRRFSDSDRVFEVRVKKNDLFDQLYTVKLREYKATQE